jgi:tetratricopeptide (TPR) repeat protein
VSSAVIQYQALDHVKEAAAALAPIDAKLASGEVKIKPDLEARLRLHQAIVARLQGGQDSFERSLKLSSEVIALRSTEYAPAAHFNAGLVKLRKSDFDGANRELEEAEVGGLSDRVKSEIYFWQAQLKQRQGDSGSAGQKYEDSAKEDPQNWRPIVAHAAMMAEASDQEVGALDKMQDLSRLDPDFYESYQRVTPYYPDPSGELLTKAERSFARIYGNHSTDSRAATALGMIAFLQKNPGKARGQISAALSETNPDRGAIVYSALLLEQKGGTENLKAAIDRFSQVKSNAPSAFLSMAIGRCLLKLGKLDDAHAALTESLQQSPYYAPAQYWMGVELQKHGDKKAALAKWSEALRYDPNYLRASQAIAEAGDT